jgi:hypothetical protein
MLHVIDIGEIENADVIETQTLEDPKAFLNRRQEAGMGPGPEHLRGMGIECENSALMLPV